MEALRVTELTNGRSDLNEILYFKGSCASESLFSILTGSSAFGGSWRGKSEILENVKIEVSFSYEWVIGS